MNALGLWLRRLWRDETGQVLTEYVILFGMVSTLCFWLWYPHNGIYKALRDRYDRTTLVLMLPGP
jgi:hypothetical protein